MIPFTPKNEDLDGETVRAILVNIGLLAGTPTGEPVTFVAEDGSPRRIDLPADLELWGEPPSWETPLVVQVSRWDPLKDPIGVMQGFAAIAAAGKAGTAELVLAGPITAGVADDP